MFACERIFGFSIILAVEKLKWWLSWKGKPSCLLQMRCN